jgi:UDP-2,3-diacylglucosamine hydrolase
MTILFISDLHLSPLRPDITDCFIDFMKNEAIHADKLYVLGDLFEFWIGDDDNSPFNVLIKEAFKALTQDLDGEKVLIMHGDTLCIDDIKYQEFRAKVHQPWLQWVFNRIPLFIRQRIVKNVQDKIKAKKQHKTLTIMDVTQSEVERVMLEEGVKRLIHGHTHRPNVHTFNHKTQEMTRIVLGDWYTQGSVLEYKNNKYTLHNKSFK